MGLGLVEAFVAVCVGVSGVGLGGEAGGRGGGGKGERRKGGVRVVLGDDILGVRKGGGVGGLAGWMDGWMGKSLVWFGLVWKRRGV